MARPSAIVNALKAVPGGARYTPAPQGNGYGTISPTVSNMYFNNPYCLAPETRILCSDLIWRPVRDLAAGDEIIGFDEKSLPGQRRKMRIAKVLACPVIQQPSYRITLDDGREVVASSEHLWKEGSGGNWIYTRNLKPGRTIMDLGEPWETDDSWKGGWLAGVFDGEASLASRTEASPGGWYISFPQNPGPVLDLCERLLKEDGYHVRHKKDPGRDIHRLHVTGIYDCLRISGHAVRFGCWTKFLAGLMVSVMHGVAGSGVASVILQR